LLKTNLFYLICAHIFDLRVAKGNTDRLRTHGDVAQGWSVFYLSSEN